MSLKRRSAAAALLVLGALLWSLGSAIQADVMWNLPSEAETSVTSPTESTDTRAAPAETAACEPAPSTPAPDSGTGRRGSMTWAYLLCFAGGAAGLAAIFWLRQKRPVLGPDGAMLLWAAALSICRWLESREYIRFWPYSFLIPLAVRFGQTLCTLCALRELWGWGRVRFSATWFAVSRLAARRPGPKLALCVYVFWIGLALGAGLLQRRWDQLLLFLGSGALGFAGLWKYGQEVQRLLQKLEDLRQGKPVAVGDGVFRDTEEQLRQLQQEHQQAIRTAVAGERFKVELITNVSHDLRTPLTAIVGYGELLEWENLSPQGREQLRRLRQKAGYMRDLVEALFELTKVSSGAAPSRMERIDLIRLLEQTIGLFDDQLSQAGISLRRSYEVQSAPLTTDGARMHQVFANLLENAIKYALTGTRIYLSVTREAGGWQVRMTNTASYEMRFQPEHIVEQFVRGNEDRSTKGSGLGLAIARTYTQSVGGSFRVSVDGDQFSAIVFLPESERNL